MLIRRARFAEPAASDITPPHLARSRRLFLSQLGVGALAASGVVAESPAADSAARHLNAAPNPAYTAKDKPTRFDDATTYNNFYEFGMDKADPAMYAGSLKTRPWTVRIEGEVKKPLTLDLDALLKLAPLEERLYRLRCVEGWSMAIPWIGYSFAELIRKVEPTGNAKFVEFTSLADPAQMRGVNSRILDWPYVEGLRIDEANHPLTLLCVGMYGQVLPNQNGAPVRWKYGFKSIKAIVKIDLVETQPVSLWSAAAPYEYGFYSNVNPDRAHPRWSQATERRIGEFGRRATLPFNGYADQVSALYAGMDLYANY